MAEHDSDRHPSASQTIGTLCASCYRALTAGPGDAFARCVRPLRRSTSGSSPPQSCAVPRRDSRFVSARRPFGSTPDSAARWRKLAVRHDRLSLVVVDYLELMRAERPSGSRVEDVSEFSRGLKRLAREMQCPVLAVAQLSRAVEQRPDKRPLLSDLRESGQIEADADCVLMLYRDDYYDRDSERPGEMDIIVRKNRQGRLGQVTTSVDSRLRYAETTPTNPRSAEPF